jgi:hypothetical protein
MQAPDPKFVLTTLAPGPTRLTSPLTSQFAFGTFPKTSLPFSRTRTLLCLGLNAAVQRKFYAQNNMQICLFYVLQLELLVFNVLTVPPEI